VPRPVSPGRRSDSSSAAAVMVSRVRPAAAPSGACTTPTALEPQKCPCLGFILRRLLALPSRQVAEAVLRSEDEDLGLEQGVGLVKCSSEAGSSDQLHPVAQTLTIHTCGGFAAAHRPCGRCGGVLAIFGSGMSSGEELEVEPRLSLDQHHNRRRLRRLISGFARCLRPDER
jgi:hypothetical protein